MPIEDKLILDLCGGTGAWSKPYVDAGYPVKIIDPLAVHPIDVRLLDFQHGVYGILAAPPCTHLASSGARWWKSKGEEALLEALSVVDACLRIILMSKPLFWCLENPIGRLSTYLGRPKMYMQPYEFSAYLDDDWKQEYYTKKTALWGNFNMPLPVMRSDQAKLTQQAQCIGWKEPDKTYIHHMPAGKDRWSKRSVTPAGFAKAFFEYNQ